MDIVSKINGNTFSATEFNQIPTELEALQNSSGQTSSDAILNQVSIATSRYAANNFYIDSGTANAYVLTLAASMTNPVSATVPYFIGMTIRFRAGNANSGASTVNVNSAGVKNLKQADGTTDLAAGDIPTTQDSEFRYDGTSFVLQTYSNDIAGKIIIWARNIAPTGYFECDGSAISRTTYSALFSIISTTFGVGNGTTTFNIPDLRGYFVRGWANAGSVDSGRAFASTQTDAFQGHYHNPLSPGVNFYGGPAGGVAASGGSALTASLTTGNPVTNGTNGTPRTASETRPTNLALMYCIKY